MRVAHPTEGDRHLERGCARGDLRDLQVNDLGGLVLVHRTGVTTTTWTSGVLATGNDYFKVAAYLSTKWVSAESAATGESTISGSGCTQP